MPDDTPPPAPAPIVIPGPPSATQTATDSAKGNAEAFKYILDQGLLPQYAQQQTDIQKQQAPQLSQLNLEQQQVYGPQLIQAALDNLKTADPTGFQVRQTYGQQIQDNLAKMGALSPEETRLAQQDVRAGQVSRGGGTGFPDAIDEAKYLGNQRYSRQQQSLADAGAFLAGTPPSAQFAGLNQAGKTAPVGTQDVSGASAALFPSTNALIGNQAQNYGIASNNANAANNLAFNSYAYRDQNTSNPFLTGLGAFGSFASNIIGGAGGIKGLAAM